MRAKFAFIAAHASEHAIRIMCRVIGATRSCYSAWQRAAPRRAERAAWRGSLGAEIEEIFLQSKDPMAHHGFMQSYGIAAFVSRGAPSPG